MFNIYNKQTNKMKLNELRQIIKEEILSIMKEGTPNLKNAKNEINLMVDDQIDNKIISKSQGEVIRDKMLSLLQKHPEAVESGKFYDWFDELMDKLPSQKTKPNSNNFNKNTIYNDISEIILKYINSNSSNVEQICKEAERAIKDTREDFKK